ncbi:MAG: proton-conducting transporter membrane subunit [Acidimicrobiales bacterium]
MTATAAIATFFLTAPLVTWTAARRGPRAAFALAALPMLLTVAWATAALPTILDGDAQRQGWSWLDALGLRVDLALDGFSALFVLLVAGVGALICLYAAWYFDADEPVGRLAGLLVAFAGAMVGLVLADNLLVLYLFWELTSITSYLLIGTKDRQAAARDAALQALLVTGAGGLAMLGGFVILAQQAGTASLSALLAAPPSGTAVEVALALVLVGALAKSAQVPLHFWLPGAMAAPTPISAYLHSATMVKAGIYLIARLSGPFAEQVGWWRPVLVGIGLATMVLGGWRALRQHDAKLLLAFGTVNQLGLLVALFGAGVPELTFAGVAVLLAHALYKAALFMVVGVIDHQTHTRDLRVLGSVSARWPALTAVAVIGSLSMAGIVPLFGFVAKEAAFERCCTAGSAPTLVTVAAVGGSVLSVDSPPALCGAVRPGPVEAPPGGRCESNGPKRHRAEGLRRCRSWRRRRCWWVSRCCWACGRG